MMTTDGKGESLTGLNQTLTSVENELLRRKTDRDDETIDNMVSQVNKLADDGVVDISNGQSVDSPDVDNADDTEDSTVVDDDPEGEESSKDSDD